METKTNGTPVTVILPEDIETAVRSVADAQMRSRSYIIVQALRAYLGLPPTDQGGL